MATITGFTAARMLEIENTTVVDGHIDGDDLVLVTRAGTEIVAGSVVGPVGPQGPNADVGDIKASMRTSLAGWLLMGQTVVGADVAYPDLWALSELDPWKSGTSLILPSMSDRILQGGGILGASTGTNTKTLLEANLPPHAHTTAAHVHSMAAHAHAMGAHTHSINHDHGAVNSGSNSASHYHSVNGNTSGAGAHSHAINVRLDPISGSAGEIGVSNAGGSITTKSTYAVGDHTHGISINSGLQSANHTHSVDLGAFVGTSGGASASNTGSAGGGNTGSAGSGNTGVGAGDSTAFSIEQAALRVNFFIKF